MEVCKATVQLASLTEIPTIIQGNIVLKTKGGSLERSNHFLASIKNGDVFLEPIILKKNEWFYLPNQYTHYAKFPLTKDNMFDTLEKHVKNKQLTATPKYKNVKESVFKNMLTNVLAHYQEDLSLPNAMMGASSEILYSTLISYKESKHVESEHEFLFIKKMLDYERVYRDFDTLKNKCIADILPAWDEVKETLLAVQEENEGKLYNVSELDEPLDQNLIHVMSKKRYTGKQIEALASKSPFVLVQLVSVDTDYLYAKQIVFTREGYKYDSIKRVPLWILGVEGYDRAVQLYFAYLRKVKENTTAPEWYVWLTVFVAKYAKKVKACETDYAVKEVIREMQVELEEDLYPSIDINGLTYNFIISFITLVLQSREVTPTIDRLVGEETLTKFGESCLAYKKDMSTMTAKRARITSKVELDTFRAMRTEVVATLSNGEMLFLSILKHHKNLNTLIEAEYLEELQEFFSVQVRTASVTELYFDFAAEEI